MTAPGIEGDDVSTSLRAPALAAASRWSTGWGWALVLVWWTLRGLTVAAIGARPLWEWTVGLALDGGVVWAWLAIALIGRRWSMVARWALFIGGMLRVAAYAHALIERGHVDVATLMLLQPRAWRVALEGGALPFLGAAVAVGWFGARIVALDASARSASLRLRGLLDDAERPVPARGDVPDRGNVPIRGNVPVRGKFALAALALIAVSYLWAPPHARSGAALAGLHSASAGLALLGIHQTRRRPLDDDARGRLAFVRLLDGATNGMGDDRPLAVRPDYVVIVLFESLSDALVSPERTPSVLALAERGQRWLGVTTVARPTHAAIGAWLCGEIPGGWPLDTRIDAIAAPVVRRHCLAASLGAQGYASAYYQGSPLSFVGQDRRLIEMGFGTRVGSEGLASHYTGTARNPWGFRDREVYDGALRQLDSWRTRQQEGLLVIVTSDAHLPSQADHRCRAGGDAFDRAFRCADEALGAFVEALNHRGLGDTLLLVVVGDHAAPDIDSVRAKVAPEFAGPFADVAVVAVGPGIGGVPERIIAAQIDLPATIEAWLGLGPGQQATREAPLRQPTALTPDRRRGGHRFGSRNDDDVLVSVAGRSLIGLRRAGLRWLGARGELVADCEQGLKSAPEIERALAPCDVVRWLDELDSSETTTDAAVPTMP